ncbi:MAG: GGDEF domain-containing protein [Halieaceae bacterium]|jgi:diguanylate cyclase (GGDEF)-like protein|nr:GGDEF domain-containing protein [Halieaceae bacterium]
MVYLRHIPAEELFSAQLELLMQHGRVASMQANLLGVLIALAVVWPYFDSTQLLLWGFGLLTLLLLRSMHMSSSLVDRRFQSRPRRLFFTLVGGSMLTGLVWSASFIYASAALPITLQYLLLLVIVIITAISLAMMVVVREYFLAFLFTALWPIAWWQLAHFRDSPQNLVLGLLLLGVTALLAAASNGIHETFARMLSLHWQQESMARELGSITDSLRDRNRQLQEARRQLTDLANVDELTGLGNRRLVNQVLRDETRRAQRAGASIAVILIDVDYFKPYNDSYGHPAGDEALRRIGEVMRRVPSRAGELVGRYGGEEFIAVLPGATAEDALHVAERLQRLIRDENLPHGASKVSDRITLSQGIVALKPDGEMAPDHLINAADEALYRAKQEGRDRIVIAPESGSSVSSHR